MALRRSSPRSPTDSRPRRRRTALCLLAGALALVLAAGCASASKREERQGRIDYHYQLGRAALEDNNLQAALVEFRNATEMDPDNVKALFALGHTLFRLGDNDGAMKAMQHVLKVNPGNGEAVNYVGIIDEQQGHLDAAIAQFQKAITLPTYATPHFAYRNLARVYRTQGRNTDAETALKAAIRRVPEYYPARADLAKLYMDENQWPKAVETWRALLDLMPDVQDAHFYLAEAYVGQGDADDAKRELTTFLAAVGAEHPLAGQARDLLKKLGATP